MTRTIVEDVLFGTLLSLIIVLLALLTLLVSILSYDIHPLLPATLLLVWVASVGYLVQTNPTNDIDLLWWYR